MTPPNRVRPTDDVLQQMRADVSSGRVTIIELARRYSVTNSCITKWIPHALPLRRFQVDPEGFREACKTVLTGATQSSVSRQWGCSREHVYITLERMGLKAARNRTRESRRLARNSGKPTNVPLNEVQKAAENRRVRREQLRVSELSKRARLRAEVDRLMEWRMQA